MRYAFVLLVLLVGADLAHAQHEKHHAPRPDTTHAGHTGAHAALPDASPEPPPGRGMPAHRDASGTSWQPESSPMEAVHTRAGSWTLMLHGTLFLRYSAQDVFGAGTRGADAFGAPNWFMAMGQRPLGSRTRLTLRSMISLDRLTEGGDGYPLLFQTGETFEGAPLIDRQHPHDLFSELAGALSRSLGPKTDLFAYAGMPGEPALGPVAFMHRPAARHLPDSPLGHHWQDATHIVFGVTTLGARYGRWKLDASLFTGREPDENRYDLDPPRFDSYSARLAVNPTDRLALQVSRGFLHEPEPLHPGQNQWRTTASALYERPAGPRSHLSTALVWGLNEPRGGHGDHDAAEEGSPAHPAYHAVLLEADLTRGPHAFYSRFEWVEKPAEELGLADFEAERPFGISALTLGAARDLTAIGPLVLTAGMQGSVFRVPAALHSEYGDLPLSAQVYLRLSPATMQGAAHQNSGH